MNLAELLFCGVSDLKDLRMVLGLETGGILVYPELFEDVSQFVEAMHLLKGGGSLCPATTKEVNSKLCVSFLHLRGTCCWAGQIQGS